jgi:phage gp36-like protein
MGTYANVTDLDLPESTLVYLTTEPNSGATWPDDTVIEAKISEADAEIDAYLRGRYDLPLESIDPVLKSIAVALVRCKLYLRRPDGPATPDAVVAACREAENKLRAIRDGKMDLTETITDTASGAKVRVLTRDRVFTESLLSQMP